MMPFFRTRASLVLCVWTAMAVPAGAKGKRAGEFFDFPTLHRFHLIIPHEGWEGMRPGGMRARRGGLFSAWAGPATRPATRPVMLDVHEHAMGGRFAYARAVLEYEGKRHGEVGVRFKGNSSYLASDTSYKRPLKVDFDRVEEKGAFFELDSLNFNNNALDPSLLREHLSYALFREAGVPAPRTALAAVTLSVEPLVVQKRLGVYVVVEDVDKKFLKSRFGTSKGLLLKPEGSGNFGYDRGEVEQTLRHYSPKTEGSPEAGARFVEFLRLLNQGNDQTFAREIESYLEMEEFLRFLAVNVLLSNYDSLLGMAHNFYVYVHPETLKLHFIPWDLNLSLGGYVRVPADEVARTSIEDPCVGSVRLVDRVLKIGKYRERYRAILRELSATLFEPGRLTRRVGKLSELIKDVRDLPREPNNPSVARGALEEPPDLEAFVRERHASVAAQLRGEVSGVVAPRFVHGPIMGYLKGSPRRGRGFHQPVER